MKKQNSVIAIPLLVISILMLLSKAWISDDAFITLRTVDNFINGYGLTWNVGERVQTYTHPFWMFLLMPVYAFARNGYAAVMLLSLIVSLTVIVVFLCINLDDWLSLLMGWGILILSKSFLDYSTSGLENPLTHLLLLIFSIVLFRSEFPLKKISFFQLTLMAGLAAFNRMDTILFFLPAIVYIFLYQHKTIRGFWTVVAGFSPFIVWELFSLFYYGFLFPNTAYAKLNSGISTGLILAQGMIYFFDSMMRDPITLVVIGTCIFFAIAGAETRIRLIASGIVLYLFYILYIGGDFMSGRFFSAPLFLSALVLTRFVRDLQPPRKNVIVALVLFVGFLSSSSILKSQPETSSLVPSNGISDERQFYYEATGLFMLTHDLDMPHHNWAEQGKQWRQQGAFVTQGQEAVGMRGYFAGPDVYVMDTLALGDPLLARLKVRSEDWRVGHYERNPVDGYFETLETGKNQIKDPNLAEYYDKLKIIISGDLWSLERWQVIWEMNTGQYDYLIKGYAD